MNKILHRFAANPVWLIVCTVLLKLPMLLSKHIQEDAFITWRVAKNFVQYGVIGFNGAERISASTTHLYVFISAFFNLIFGELFIVPVLVFSSLLFAIGAWWLALILFPQHAGKRALFFVALNMCPPALTASMLGMEYGILFFLYMGLIHFAWSHGKSWAYIVFPILLLWTRLDAVIFLGLFFLADLYYRRRFNLLLIIGGAVGLSSVMAFNMIYFNELVNHTITAKQIAYKNLIRNNSPEFLLIQWAYYGGLIKKYSLVTLLIFLGFLAALAVLLYSVLKRYTPPRLTKQVLFFVLCFALIKITIFSVFRAYFDWYYWVPRVFLFAGLFYGWLMLFQRRSTFLVSSVLIFSIGMYFFQWIQSYTVGYMEERQRMQIAADIGAPGLQKSIMLEPAGIIPYFTQLYTYDEVGLVNARINDEMLKDEKYWWINSVRHYKPDYILAIEEKPAGSSTYYRLRDDDTAYFKQNYRLVKEYNIRRIHETAPALLKEIYRLRRIGKDYFLYQRISSPE